MDFGLSSLNSDMGSNGDYDLEYSDPDACLNPVDRLEKYVESEHMYSRQLAARSLLETLQQVDDFSDAKRVLNVLTTLADDADGVVRTELCEQLAHIGNVCVESRTIFTSGDTSYDPLSSDILPIIFRYMTDPNNQVRKTSQTALAELVEQHLVTNDDVVSKVSPIISRLADMDSSEDHRSEAASLLCRLAPIVGAELTEQLFLDLFLNFCTDHTFQIRKICAVNFGSICQVVGCEKTESLLLKKFFCLCTDAIWGVRKACTECFMQVSLVCTPGVRHSQLSAVFINLIADQSRWVRMAAFETLGGFISTFANPDATGLRLTDDGTIVIADPSILLGEKRTENVRETVDLRAESAVILDNTTIVAPEYQPAITVDSGNISIGSNGGQMSHDIGDKPLDISDCCRNEVVSSFVPQDTVYADNDVDALNEFTGVDRSEIPADGQIVSGGERSDETESKPIVDSAHTQEADERKTLGTPQKVLENGVEESEGLDGVVLENGPGEEVRWNLNGMVDQSVDAPGDKTEDALVDENLSVNSHTVTSAVGNCQLTNGPDSTPAVDTRALDVCLESNAVLHAAADSMMQQFGSLNFWQLSEANRQEDSSDTIMQPTENSPFSSSDPEKTTPAERNLLNSKLLDSISHLCDSAVTVNETISANHAPLADVVENGDVGSRGQSDDDIQESNDVQNAEPLVENFEPKDENLDRSAESESNSVVPMECADDKNHTEAVTDPEESSSALEAGEITEFTGSGRHKISRPQLQLLDDLTDTKGTSVDDAVGLENGIDVNEEDVDEEEICELVAAAKDVLCDDIAIYEQDVVPSDLLEQYLSMMDPSCAQKVDSEITRHCAYSLPAVAYTLGRKNWSSLKNLYRTLASDVQWKVRRTLAFSIHELALIVGEEITSRDLVPVFDGFLNDLDEVRIGVLKHLADFLKLLPVETRCGYLLKITELLKTDNSRNWRFREELARQLFLLLGLFTVADIQEHICPIALHLAQDRVAQVRLAAVRVLSHILKQLVKHVDGDEGHSIWTSYLEKLEEQFARSKTCSKRQMYVQLCSCILQDEVISNECFAEKFLPTLLSLRHDVIPNVRLTLARSIAQHIRQSEFFSSSQNPHHEDVRRAISSLEEDQDRDVRFLIDVKTNDVVEPNDVVEHSSDEIEA